MSENSVTGITLRRTASRREWSGRAAKRLRPTTDELVADLLGEHTGSKALLPISLTPHPVRPAERYASQRTSEGGRLGGGARQGARLWKVTVLVCTWVGDSLDLSVRVFEGQSYVGLAPRGISGWRRSRRLFLACSPVLRCHWWLQADRRLVLRV